MKKLELDKETMLQLSNLVQKDQSVKLAADIFQKNIQMMKPDFKQLMQKTFKVVPESLLSAEQVNKWCATHTNDKITSIIEDINGVETILISAIHFKANWKYQFDK